MNHCETCGSMWALIKHCGCDEEPRQRSAYDYPGHDPGVDMLTIRYDTGDHDDYSEESSP